MNYTVEKISKDDFSPKNVALVQLMKVSLLLRFIWEYSDKIRKEIGGWFFNGRVSDLDFGTDEFVTNKNRMGLFKDEMVNHFHTHLFKTIGSKKSYTDKYKPPSGQDFFSVLYAGSEPHREFVLVKSGVWIIEPVIRFYDRRILKAITAYYQMVQLLFMNENFISLKRIKTKNKKRKRAMIERIAVRSYIVSIEKINLELLSWVEHPDAKEWLNAMLYKNGYMPIENYIEILESLKEKNIVKLRFVKWYSIIG